MISTAKDLEDDRALLKPFRLGLLGVAIAFVLLGSLIAAFGSGADRPEGVAERWLASVGDTRRDGVKDRARDEVEEVGSLELGDQLLPDGDTGGRAAFTDLEVGKAETDAEGATRVPFRVRPSTKDEVLPAIDGTLVMTDADGDWKVIALEDAVEGRQLPSEGGAPAAEAPLALFAGAIGVAVLITAGCSVVVRRAGRAGQAEAA